MGCTAKEKKSDKYKWTMNPFHADSSQNYDFSLEEKENYIDIISDTSSKFHFSRNSYVEFWMGVGGEFSHLSRKALDIILHFATLRMCETGFSAVAAIKTK
jgi:hypothetical protein